jgi:PBP1b-binding outer membrane lipoprotein LpoB
MAASVLFLRCRRAVVPVFAALALAGCSTAPQSQYNAPRAGITPVDAPEPQNLQEKPIDLTAQPSSASGGMKALDAQGDISQLLNQIHNEQSAPKK